MQKDVLMRIFPGGSASLGELLSVSRQEAPETREGIRLISEYEIYGAFLTQVLPERACFATWGNKGEGVRSELKNGTGRGEWSLSTSYHHYRFVSRISDQLL